MTPEELQLIEQESAAGLDSGISPEELSEIEGGSGTFEPTFGEKAEQLGVGTLQGLKTGLTTLGPAFKGAQYGARLGAPFGPYPALAGGTVGFVGGLVAGSEVSDYLDQFFPIPPREDLIPYREGAKTFGESAAALPYAFGIPQMSGTLVNNFISGIGQYARRSPVTFSTMELTASGFAGLGGGIAEYVDPGDPGTRALYEITGGLFAPGKLFVNAGSTVYDYAKQVKQGLKPNVMEVKAANELERILLEAGEDPEKLIGLLRKPLPAGVSPTAGQATGVPVLNALESSLAKYHAKYSGEIRDQGENAFKAYQMMVSKLRDIGTPDALRRAAEMQDQYFSKLIGDRLAFAHADAAEKISRISRDTPAARAELGRIVRDNVDSALKEARDVESQLWQTAYKKSFEPSNLPPSDELDLIRDPRFEMDSDSFRQLRTYGTKKELEANPDAYYMAGGRTIYLDDRHKSPTFREYILDEDGYYEVSYDMSRAMYGPDGTFDYRTPLQTTGPYKSIAPKSVEIPGVSRAVLETITSFTPEAWKYDVSPKVKDMIKRLGVTDSMVQRYQAGQLTDEFLNTGVIPDRFAISPDEIKSVSVPDLIKIRSDLLSDARRATTGSDPDPNMARVYGNLAEAVLDDLGQQLKSKDYDIARQYSRALNDTFTRTFAGEMQQKGLSGAEKLPAEILVSRAFGRGSDLTALRMDQIEDTANFMLDQQRQITGQFPRTEQSVLLRSAVPGSKQRLSSILDAQTRIMRLGAAEAVENVRNPQTGQIEQRLNTGKLMRWAAENKPMLDKLGITADLENAERAENFFKLAQKQNSVINQRLRKQTTFDKILGAENPTKVVTQVLRSANPLTGMNRLTKLAKKGGQDAVDGLRSTVFDYAYTQAFNPRTGGMSPLAFERAMFEPIAKNKPSLYAMMRSQGIMTRQDGDNIRALINPMKRIEDELRRGNAVDEIVTAMGPAGDLALRIIGAKAGSMASQAAGGSGGSLIAAAAGSKYMREVFDKMPNASITSILERATKDPAFMADLLERRARLDRDKLRLARQIHGYLLAQGYTDAPYTIEDVEEVPPTPTTGMSAASLMRQVKGPPTRGLPFISQAQAAPPAQGPQPTAQGPGPAAPASSRQMLQSLFPFDTTLQLPQ